MERTPYDPQGRIIFPQGPLKQIHLDKAAVKANADAIWVVRYNGQKHIVRSVVITGPAQSRTSFDVPLQPEGTYAWVETNSAVIALP